MNEYDAGDTDYTDGKDYTYSIVVLYAGDGTLTYKFSFNDGASNATGNPANDNTFTLTMAGAAAAPIQNDSDGYDDEGWCWISTVKFK